MNKLTLVLKAARELGIRKLLCFGRYKLGLKSGHYRRMTPAVPSQSPTLAQRPTTLNQIFTLPDAQFIGMQKQVLAEAKAICAGQVRLFGDQLHPLNLAPQPPLAHWTEYESGKASWSGPQDIKFIWEPARFSWAFTLARAYAVNLDEACPQAFWQAFETFQQANPPNLGPNWLSSQEVALRILAFIFCDQIFAKSVASTPQRRQQLWQSIADHAQRIPPTLVYARAQNNNHLLSEAVGLFSAAVYLPDHPKVKKWLRLGWHWFNWGIQHQVSPGGTYVQHSTNYHRLMLQLALWMQTLTQLPGAAPLPQATLSRLASATNWLWALTDPKTGRVPNLGSNDGAHIMPLSGQPFHDYRPVVQAAARAFLGKPLFPPGPWDELSTWLSLPSENTLDVPLPQPQAADMPRLENAQSRAFMHTAHFSDRPSHADQLHVDLWWQSENIALDAGTYAYNAPPPWDNPLSASSIHNTLTINGQDQMLRAGRFLWLNWAQAQRIEERHDADGHLLGLTAQHDGFCRLGFIHRRTLTALQNGDWCVDDLLTPTYKKLPKSPNKARLSWLLPDWPWSFEGNTLALKSPLGKVLLTVKGAEHIALVRSGKCIYGNMNPQPFWGWHSPTYGVKLPALMLIAEKQAYVKLFFTSLFHFDA